MSKKHVGKKKKARERRDPTENTERKIKTNRH
jgi:hypothetical protein